jgi:LPS export ABC transporter protein LptC
VSRAVALRLVAVSLAAGALAACSGDAAPPAAAGQVDAMLDSADHVAFGFRTNVTDGGVLRAEVFADTALFMDQNTRANLRGVNGDFFGATGSKEATVVARTASFDTRTQNLEAWGDVVITSVDGRVLRTPQIRYDQRANEVSSDSAFVLTEPGNKEMRGVGFRADPNLSVVRVLRLDQGRGGTINLSRP